MSIGGHETRDRIVESAVELFAARWYSSVSIAEICRHAGVSNGVFYRYFSNKEALFKHVLEDVIDLLASDLEKTEGADLYSRIASMTGIIVRFSLDHPDLITVFREGQYRYFEYERRLTEMYRTILAQVMGRQVEVHEYLFAIGGPRFGAIRKALQGANVSIHALADIVANGVFRGLEWDAGKVFDISIAPPAIKLAESSRERLMRVGKKLFGERGFHSVNIHEITDAAGLSVGAFYKYFDSKETFYKEQITAAGREIRHFITANLRPGLNRLEQEMQGIFLFSVYLSLDHWCYNIVREGEFVAPATVREYYRSFHQGYLKMGTVGLDPEALAADPAYLDSIIEFLMGVSHYHGFEVAFDRSPHNARTITEGIGHLLVHGLAGERW